MWPFTDLSEAAPRSTWWGPSSHFKAGHTDYITPEGHCPKGKVRLKGEGPLASNSRKLRKLDLGTSPIYKRTLCCGNCVVWAEIREIFLVLSRKSMCSEQTSFNKTQTFPEVFSNFG